MAPSTAIIFLIFDFIIIFFPILIKNNKIKLFTYFFVILVLIYSFLVLLVPIIIKGGSFENFLFPSSSNLNGIPIGQMSPATAVVFMILGLTLLLFLKNVMKPNYGLSTTSVGILGILTAFIALIFILGYFYDNPLLYNQGFTIPMAFTTSISFFLLSISILLSSDTKTFPLKLFLSGTTESQLLIIFFPLSLMAVFSGSIILTITANVLLINRAFLSALMIALISVITTYLVFYVSKKISISLNNNEQARLKTLVTNLQEGIIMFSESSEILFMNNLGKNYLELVNSKYEDTDNDENNNNIIKPFLLNKLQEKKSFVEKIVIGREYKYFELLSNKIINNQVENINTLLIRDITEKKMQLKLIEKFSKIVEQASNSIIITNENGIIEYTNSGLLLLTGLSKNDLIGKNFSTTLTNESNVLYNKILKEFDLSKSNWKGQFQHLRSDNKNIWVSASMVKLIDEKGEILNYFIIEDDITHIKELSNKLEENTLSLFKEKLKFESILNNIPFGVAVISENREILFVNNSLKTIVFSEFGLKIEVGTIINNIEKLNFIEKKLSEIKTFKTNKIIMKYESNTHWELSINLIENDILKNIFIIILKDVTEFVEFQMLQKRFISTVSHELRTPIAAIQLSVNNYNNYFDKLNENQRINLLAIISQNSILLQNMVEDLLILSRIEGKTLTFRTREKIFIKIQIQTLLMQISYLLKEKNLTISLIEKGDPVINGDVDRFNQIIRIILENAIKYSFKNREIIVSFESNYYGEYNIKNTEGVLISIQDFGKGIPLNEQKFIGKRFFRASNVDTIEGTGIGLSILKEILILFSAEYHFKSVEEKGTTFFIFLPVINEKPNVLNVM
jgi:PAS domain S-box-containing protein